MDTSQFNYSSASLDKESVLSTHASYETAHNQTVLYMYLFTYKMRDTTIDINDTGNRNFHVCEALNTRINKKVDARIFLLYFLRLQSLVTFDKRNATKYEKMQEIVKFCQSYMYRFQMTGLTF